MLPRALKRMLKCWKPGESIWNLKGKPGWVHLKSVGVVEAGWVHLKSEGVRMFVLGCSPKPNWEVGDTGSTRSGACLWGYRKSGIPPEVGQPEVGQRSTGNRSKVMHLRSRDLKRSLSAFYRLTAIVVPTNVVRRPRPIVRINLKKKILNLNFNFLVYDIISFFFYRGHPSG